MDYKKLHDNFIEYCKQTTPKQRLIKRDSEDVRLLEKTLYTEIHHIIPKHDGGTNDLENLVILLPEEHYMIHLIRYKAYKQRGDFLSVRFIVNGFLGKKYINFPMSVYRKVKKWKHHIQMFRKNNNWHTKKGLEAIAAAQRDYFNAKDKNGAIIRVKTNDPRVLSGELVHHTRGTQNVRNKKTGKISRIPCGDYDKSIYEYPTDMSGAKNPNFKKMTPDRIKRVKQCVLRSADEKNVVRKDKLQTEIKNEFKNDFKKISLVWVTNNFNLKNLCEELKLELFDLKKHKGSQK